MLAVAINYVRGSGRCRVCTYMSDDDSDGANETRDSTEQAAGVPCGPTSALVPHDRGAPHLPSATSAYRATPHHTRWVITRISRYLGTSSCTACLHWQDTNNITSRTGAVMMLRAAAPQPRTRFVADRPFIYLLLVSDNTIMFSGSFRQN